MDIKTLQTLIDFGIEGVKPFIPSIKRNEWKQLEVIKEFNTTKGSGKKYQAGIDINSQDIIDVYFDKEGSVLKIEANLWPQNNIMGYHFTMVNNGGRWGVTEARITFK